MWFFSHPCGGGTIEHESELSTTKEAPGTFMHKKIFGGYKGSTGNKKVKEDEKEKVFFLAFTRRKIHIVAFCCRESPEQSRG
jgi:hypothetical protein